jgi:hypothetical protein
LQLQARSCEIDIGNQAGREPFLQHVGNGCLQFDFPVQQVELAPGGTIFGERRLHLAAYLPGLLPDGEACGFREMHCLIDPCLALASRFYGDFYAQAERPWRNAAGGVAMVLEDAGERGVGLLPSANLLRLCRMPLGAGNRELWMIVESSQSQFAQTPGLQRKAVRGITLAFHVAAQIRRVQVLGSELFRRLLGIYCLGLIGLMCASACQAGGNRQTCEFCFRTQGDSL